MSIRIVVIRFPPGVPLPDRARILNEAQRLGGQALVLHPEPELPDGAALLLPECMHNAFTGIPPGRLAFAQAPEQSMSLSIETARREIVLCDDRCTPAADILLNLLLHTLVALGGQQAPRKTSAPTELPPILLPLTDTWLQQEQRRQNKRYRNFSMILFTGCALALLTTLAVLGTSGYGLTLFVRWLSD